MNSDRDFLGQCRGLHPRLPSLGQRVLPGVRVQNKKRLSSSPLSRSARDAFPATWLSGFAGNPSFTSLALRGSRDVPQTRILPEVQVLSSTGVVRIGGDAVGRPPQGGDVSSTSTSSRALNTGQAGVIAPCSPFSENERPERFQLTDASNMRRFSETAIHHRPSLYAGQFDTQNTNRPLGKSG